MIVLGGNVKKGYFYTIEDYEITKEGEIINKHNGKKRILQPNSKGYLRVMINKKNLLVHRLVATKYVPNPNNLPQVNHKDGNKLNNDYRNLEWVTNQENRTHAVENGLHLSGERCKYSKLKEEDVIFILKHTEYKIYELKKMFNVSRSAISSIRNGRTWKHLKRYAEL